jgi:hypothetical protein
LEGPEINEIVAGGIVDYIDAVSLAEDVIGVGDRKVSRWGLRIAEQCKTGDKK